MAITRSYYNKAVAASYLLGHKVAIMIAQLGEYVGHRDTDRDTDCLLIKEWIRSILEKIEEYYAIAIAHHKGGMVTWTGRDILPSVDKAKHQATELMYGERDGINEALEAVTAKILELDPREARARARAVKMETADDEGPAAKKIKLE